MVNYVSKDLILKQFNTIAREVVIPVNHKQPFFWPHATLEEPMLVAYIAN